MQGDGVWTSVRELPVAMEYLGGVSLNNHILMTGKTRLPASRSSSVGPEGRFSFFHPKVKVKKIISLTSSRTIGQGQGQELDNMLGFLK